MKFKNKTQESMWYAAEDKYVSQNGVEWRFLGNVVMSCVYGREVSWYKMPMKISSDIMKRGSNGREME